MERLRECVDVMRALWAGEEVTHRGHIVVDRARLWSLPDEPPRLVAGAISEATARWAAGWADGLITVNQPRDTLRRIVAAYRDAGGRGDLHLQVHLAHGADDVAALDVAYEQWRSNCVPTVLAWDLELPAQFEAATRHVPREAVAENVRVSADLGRHAAWLREDRGSGSTSSTCITSARSRRRSSTRSGRACCRSCGREADPDQRPVVEAGGRLLPRRADLLRRGRRRRRRLRRACPSASTTSPISASTCLWLMPFYPTADVDDGYDITDFYAVDPGLGSFGDFTEFVRTAQDRGLRVIADLVCNHTSAKHPWFQAARSDPASPYRDFYVWRDERPPEQPGDVVFPDKEASIWSYDRTAKQYYLHRFYRSQPDLNVANPRVRDEIAKIMGFWMQLGLSGFRVDAVPFLIDTAGIDGGSEALPDPHAYLRDLRAFLNRRRGDGVLLGEVNLSHQDARAFFGDEDGDEVTLLFDFPTMQACWLALARADAGPIRSALGARLPAPADSQWAVFLRNHDELTLDKLSGAERAEVFEAFGPEPACSSTAAACAGGCRRCWAATSAASGSRTA